MSRQIEGMLDKVSWSLRALGVTTCERAQRLPDCHRLSIHAPATRPVGSTECMHLMTPKDGVDHFTREINAARSDPTIS
jgi:hypothetical protein